VPVEQVDKVQPVLPPQCEYCGEALPQQLDHAQTVGAPQRHQLIELPDIKAEITEHQLYLVSCGKCGESTRATLPEEGKGNFGRLTALVVYLTVSSLCPGEQVLARWHYAQCTVLIEKFRTGIQSPDYRHRNPEALS
jgi:hypothetical protein